MTDQQTDMTAAELDELRRERDSFHEKYKQAFRSRQEFVNEAASLRKQLDEAREREAQIWRVVSAKAREWSEHYEHGTDGRNTFVLFAEWVESAALSQEPAASHAAGLLHLTESVRLDPSGFEPGTDEWMQAVGLSQQPASPSPVLRDADTAPAPAISGGEMAFERFPKLTDHILRMASTGHTGSTIEWSDFLGELNAALAAADRSAS